MPRDLRPQTLRQEYSDLHQTEDEAWRSVDQQVEHLDVLHQQNATMGEISKAIDWLEFLTEYAIGMTLNTEKWLQDTPQPFAHAIVREHDKRERK